MNKLIILGLAATFGAGNFALRATQGNPPVELQTTAPGTAQTGHLNITGTATVGILKSQNTVFGQSTAPTGFAYGGFFTAASDQARGFYGYASSPTGLTYGGFFQNASASGRAVYGLATATSGFNYGGYFQTASTSGRGLLGVAAASTGTTYGVYGKSTSPAGFGVYSDGNMAASGVISGNGSGLTSVNAATLGGLSSSAFLQAIPVPLTLSGNNSNHIIKGENASTSTGSAGVVGLATSVSGNTYGVFGRSASAGGIGVYGRADTASGFAYGVHGRTASATGSGVWGYATAATGSTLGVQGLSDSTEGRGVSGRANSSTGTNYGVRGHTYSPAGFGVYSVGNMGSSGVKPFRIDHPFDPENKYLLHYASESPVPQNFYVGNVITDARGYAWVELPEYFSEISANFKYQLTVVGKSFAQAVVWDEITNNRFQVRTSEPNIKVSWRVDADRNDLYVRNRPPKDVVDKEGREKGMYQHPEFYNLGPERGMNYDPTRDKGRSKVPPVQESNRLQNRKQIRESSQMPLR